MAREKKDSKPFCGYISRDVHDLLDTVSRKLGQSKTVVVERAIRLYADRNGIFAGSCDTEGAE